MDENNSEAILKLNLDETLDYLENSSTTEKQKLYQGINCFLGLKKETKSVIRLGMCAKIFGAFCLAYVVYILWSGRFAGYPLIINIIVVTSLIFVGSLIFQSFIERQLLKLNYDHSCMLLNKVKVTHYKS